MRPPLRLQEGSRLAMRECTAGSFDGQLCEQFLGKFESRWVFLEQFPYVDRMAVLHAENAWFICHDMRKEDWIDRRMGAEFDSASILIECEPANSDGLTIELEFTDSKERFCSFRGWSEAIDGF